MPLLHPVMTAVGIVVFSGVVRGQCHSSGCRLTSLHVAVKVKAARAISMTLLDCIAASILKRARTVRRDPSCTPPTR